MFRALIGTAVLGMTLVLVGATLAIFFSSDDFVPLSIAFMLFAGLGLMSVCTILMFPLMGLSDRYIEKSLI